MSALRAEELLARGTGRTYALDAARLSIVGPVPRPLAAHRVEYGREGRHVRTREVPFELVCCCVNRGPCISTSVAPSSISAPPSCLDVLGPPMRLGTDDAYT
jgi:hypothetical protein